MEASGSSKRQPHWTRGLGSGRRCTPSPGWVGGGGQAGQGVSPPWTESSGPRLHGRPWMRWKRCPCWTRDSCTILWFNSDSCYHISEGRVRISEMMQKVLKENILSLVECRTWPSLQSRQARGRRAALTCPEGGGGQCCVSWWCRVVFQSHPRDSWVREGRVPAVAGPGRALSLRTERKRHRSAGVSRALADVPRGDRPPQQPWPRSGGEPGRGLLGVSAAARLGHAPPTP